MSGGIHARLADIRARIAAAASESGRTPDEVTLVAVAKAFPADAVADAVAAGAADIGESRVQELVAKAEAMTDGVRWHFVGHLQKNKARAVVGLVCVVHSLDRMSLAQEIAKRARADGVDQRVLIEVNVAGEDSKHGVAPAEVVAFAAGAASLEGLEVAGLMTIPPEPRRPEDSRRHFATLRELRDEVTAQLPAATSLSMGMSRDFEVAIQEGATLVRIGEAIFGSRTNQSRL